MKNKITTMSCDGDLIRLGFMASNPRGQSWEKHVIDLPGGVFSVRNSGTICWKKQIMSIPAGQLALYKALPRHQFSSGKDWSYFWFHVPESFFEPFANVPCNTNIPSCWLSRFSPRESKQIHMELNEALACQNGNSCQEKLMETLLRLVLLRVLNSLPATQPSETPEAFSECIRALANSSSHENIDRLATRCGMSRATFFRRFRKAFGCSPIEYRHNVLISQAKILLHSTGMQIKEIAEHLHFKNEYYFSSFFRSRTGTTPTAYRKNRAVHPE
jgi:AraC-like DNA-binding protein